MASESNGNSNEPRKRPHVAPGRAKEDASRRVAARNPEAWREICDYFARLLMHADFETEVNEQDVLWEYERMCEKKWRNDEFPTDVDINSNPRFDINTEETFWKKKDMDIFNTRVDAREHVAQLALEYSQEMEKEVAKMRGAGVIADPQHLKELDTAWQHLRVLAEWGARFETLGENAPAPRWRDASFVDQGVPRMDY